MEAQGLSLSDPGRGALSLLQIAQGGRRINKTLMKSVHNLATILIVSISLLGSGSVAQAQTAPTGNCRYFPETGHYVCNEFLAFFETRGDLKTFGYPLTEAFVDPTHDGLWVQYFQRARMEEHPHNQPPYDVQLGLLIDELGYTYPSADPDELPEPGAPSHHYFPETQHVVSYAFLDFFRENGGLDIFGYPRSEMVYEGGLVVQYFQRARMEWHRERTPGDQIVLTNVGEMYIERFGLPGDYDRRVDDDLDTDAPEIVSRHHQVFLPLIILDAERRRVRPTPTEPSPTVPSPAAPTPTAPSGNVTALNVSASVRYPITGRTGTQTAYIYVNDQEERPVAGAEGVIVVHYPSTEVTCVTKPTDAAGFTRCSFDIPSPPVGKQVTIDITVTYEGLTATTQTSFMPWW